MLRPEGLPALKSPAVSNVRRVLHDGPRSAEPPISHGTFFARTAHHAITTLCQLGVPATVVLEACPPGCMQDAASRADAGLKMLVHAGRHEKLRILRPSIPPFSQTDFFFA